MLLRTASHAAKLMVSKWPFHFYFFWVSKEPYMEHTASGGLTALVTSDSDFFINHDTPHGNMFSFVNQESPTDFVIGEKSPVTMRNLQAYLYSGSRAAVLISIQESIEYMW